MKEESEVNQTDRIQYFVAIIQTKPKGRLWPLNGRFVYSVEIRQKNPGQSYKSYVTSDTTVTLSGARHFAKKSLKNLKIKNHKHEVVDEYCA